MATQSGIASFNGTQDSVAVTWTAMPGNFSIFEGVTVTSGPPVTIWRTAVSSSGATFNTSARFTGEVDWCVVDR